MSSFTEDWFWAAIQAAGLLITLSLILRQIQLQTATHTVQTLEAIHQRWNEEPMLRARHTVCQRYLSNQHSFDSIGQFIAEYMEELGIYLKLKAISPDSMWDTYSWYIEHYYCMFRDEISRDRKDSKEEHLYENFEALFQQLKAISAVKGAPDADRKTGEIQKFARDEVKRTSAFLELQRVVR